MDATILIGIAVLLLAAKIFGEAAARLRISPIVGEIFAGIVVGPLFHLINIGSQFGDLLSFGILFLLFLSGLSSRIEDIKNEAYTGVALCIAGGALSAVLGYAFGMIFFQDQLTAVFIAVAIISSSTAVAVRSMVDIGEIETANGKKVLAVMMSDDVMAVAALAILTAYITSGNIVFDDATKLVLMILGFFIVLASVGTKIVNKLVSIGQKMRDEQAIFSLALVVLFIVAAISEKIGVAAVTGAFLAGLILSKNSFVSPVIVPKVKTIGYGLFIPLFFAYTGMSVDLNALHAFIVPILVLTVLAIAGKLVGVLLTGRYFGIKKRELFIIGTAMVPRGEYALVISQIALTVGAISRDVFSIVMGVVLLTIIATPLLMQLAKRKRSSTSLRTIVSKNKQPWQIKMK
ncbi:MAG: cation:proton antiporter [Candidatus Aenigmatarchaeota archaeon]